MVSRDHHDIDLIARPEARERVWEVAGSIAHGVAGDDGLRLRFFRRGISTDVIFFYAQSDGTFGSDLDAADPSVYPWPPGSFPEGSNACLAGTPSRAITWEAKYAAKQGCSHFREESELRQKDETDLRVIRDHLAVGAAAM